MPIPILFFIDFLYKFSGTEKHLYDLLSNLNRKKFKPFVITFQGSDDFKELIEKMGIQIQILDISKIYGFKPFYLFFKLRSFIKKEKIKIIQTFHTNPDIYGTVLAKFSGIPIVISSRRDMGFNRNKRNVLCYKVLDRFVDSIICVSEAVKKLVINEEGVDPGKMVVVYNGIDPEAFNAQADAAIEKKKLNLSSNHPVIGVLANFNPIKGHIYFIEAAAIIKNQFKEAQFVLIGGMTGNNVEEQLKKRVSELGLEQCVHFLGYRRDIAEVLSVIDILVAPSLSEGFSNTIVEALYMRKAVVATNVGGNPEIIKEGQTGLLVKPADPEAIASAVLRLLNDKESALRMGESGRECVKKYFTIDKMMEKTMDIYKTLADKKRIKI